MASSCETYFNPLNLEASSMETEVGWSTLCIPNTTKLAIFLVMLAWAAINLFVCAALTVVEWRNSRSWTLRRKVFGLLTLGMLTQVILLLLYIAGVQSPGRYILMPMIGNAFMGSSIFMTQVFIKVFSENIQNLQADLRLLNLQKRNAIFLGGASVIQTVVYGILPIVFYDNPVVLNALYSTVITFMMLVSAVICWIFAKVAHRVVSLLHPSVDIELAPDLLAVKKKLQGSVWVGIIFGTISLFGMIFPLWIGLTAVDGDSGMQGIFYFHFCFLLPFHFNGYASVVWTVMKAKTKGGSSISTSQHEKRIHDSSRDNRVSEIEKQPASFPSFTVEELNGANSSSPLPSRAL